MSRPGRQSGPHRSSCARAPPRASIPLAALADAEKGDVEVEANIQAATATACTSEANSDDGGHDGDHGDDDIISASGGTSGITVTSTSLYKAYAKLIHSFKKLVQSLRKVFSSYIKYPCCLSATYSRFFVCFFACFNFSLSCFSSYSS